MYKIIEVLNIGLVTTLLSIIVLLIHSGIILSMGLKNDDKKMERLSVLLLHIGFLLLTVLFIYVMVSMVMVLNVT